MRKCISLVTALLVVMAVQAKDITEVEAQKIANAFRSHQRSNGRLRASAVKKATVKAVYGKGNKQVMAYLLNYGDSDGFVVVAGDDCVSPVLGYSDTGNIDESNMPQNMRGWFESVSSEIEAIKNGRGVAVRTADTSEGEIVVDALVKTKWYQLTPYNNMDPKGCLTGCVATAMAQIMNYHKWPKQGTGSNSYQYTVNNITHQVSVDFSESTYDWDNMLPTYADNNWNDAQANAVALLMRDCGAAANMQYGITVSNSTETDACYAGNNNFNYSTEVFYHDDYSTEEFETLIKSELNDSRPVLFTGQSSTSGGNGHAFIVDGYRSDGKFHVNWGWNGEGDGFFSLCLMNPGAQYYYPAMQAISTFSPNKDTAGTKYNRAIRMLDITDGGINCGVSIDSDLEADKNSSFQVNLRGILSPSFREYDGQVGLGLYDADDHLEKDLTWVDVQLNNSMGLKDTCLTVASGAIDEIADGTYTIKAISREMVNNEYLPVRKISIGGQRKYLNVVVSGSSVKISNIAVEKASVSLVNPVSLPERMAMFTDYSLSLSLKNNSNVPQEGHIHFDLKSKTDESRSVNMDVSNFVLYDGQQVDIPIVLGFTAAKLTEGDYLARFSFFDKKGDTLQVEGLGEWIPVSLYLDETKIPKVKVDSVSITVANDIDDTNIKYCDPSDVEIDLANDFYVDVNVYYSFVGEVWQSTSIRVANMCEESQAIYSLGNVLLQTDWASFNEGTGEYDFPIEYKNVVTREWQTVEGSPSSIHVRVIDSSTGIGNVNADEWQTARYYDIYGRQLPKSQKGLNIVVLPNGKVTKRITGK